MKIISWNICGIGTRNEKGLLDKLLDEDPDILCLQEIKKQEIIPATGHKLVTDAAIAATCTQSGLTDGNHCSVCKEVIKKQETVPATGHKLVTDAAIAATCTQSGLTEGSHCSVCEEVIQKQETVPATGHHYC